MSKKTMIRIGVIQIMALFVHLSCVSQVVFSEWIAGKGTKGWDIVNDMTCDRNGNIYITGSFTDTLAKYRSESTAVKTGRSMYLAKFDTNGKIIWSKNIRPGGSGFGSLIARGKNDELILVGGEEISGVTTGRKSGRSGFFISSLDTNGTTHWTQNFTGSKPDYLTALVVDTLRAEIMVTGYFHDTLHIGEKTLVTSGMSDGVFLLFDLSGNLKSVKVIGGKGEDKLNGMANNSLGNRYLAGTFQRKIQFEKNTVLELNNRQELGLFVARYNDKGDFTAAKHLATGKKIRVHSISSINECIIIAGSFSDQITIGNKTLSSLGSDDVILVCIDKEMQIKWHKQIGGTRKDRPSKIINLGKEIILSGSFSSSIIIDHKTLTASGTGSNVFVIAYDISGNLRWMRSTGGEAEDYPTCMVTAGKDYIYLAGSFRQKFGMNGKSLESVGEEDVFIGRMENCHSLAPTFKQPECFCEGTQLQLDAGEEFISYDWANGLGRERMFDVNQAGKYPLELVAANGCIIYDTVKVVESPQPNVNLGNDTTIADSSRITLHAGGKFAHYLWNNGTTKSENLINGVELKEGPNQVKVSVTSDKGCVGSGAMVINMIRTMPDRESEIVSGSCVIFPNPTSDLVTAYFTMSFKSVTIIIHDMTGKELLTQTVSGYIKNTPFELNLGALPKGLYPLYIKTDLGTATRKIVLQ
jgi:hypothetical protein